VTKLEKIALAIYRKVVGAGAETRWEDLSETERVDALGWANAALMAARERDPDLAIAPTPKFGRPHSTRFWGRCRKAVRSTDQVTGG
jgi:hypothetical protein